MSGTRSSVVQILRTATPNAAPAPYLLLDGELAIEQADPMRLWGGAPSTLDSTGRKLIYDAGANPGATYLPLTGGVVTGPITFAPGQLIDGGLF